MITYIHVYIYIHLSSIWCTRGIASASDSLATSLSIYLCTHGSIYMYVYLILYYVYVYICICIHTCMYIYIYVYIYIHLSSIGCTRGIPSASNSSATSAIDPPFEKAWIKPMNTQQKPINKQKNPIHRHKRDPLICKRDLWQSPNQIFTNQQNLPTNS